MSFEEKKVVYDDAAKEWQIRTYEGEEEVLEARKSVAPEEADLIGYDHEGNIVLRDTRSIQKNDLSNWRLYENKYGDITAGSVGITVGLAATQAALNFALTKNVGKSVAALSDLVFDPLGSRVGHIVRNALAERIGYHYLPTEQERRHPATIDMTISHEQASWFKFLGNCVKWGARIVGAIAGGIIGGIVGGTAGSIVPFAGTAAGIIIGVVGGALNGMGIADAATGPIATGLESFGDNLASVTGKIVEGSPNVFFNGKSAARLGDRVLCHDHSNHPDNMLIEGSKTVFINGLPMVRVGHLAACGAFVSEGVEYAYTGLLTTSMGQPAPTWWEEKNDSFEDAEFYYSIATFGKGFADLGRGFYKAARGDGWRAFQRRFRNFRNQHAEDEKAAWIKLRERINQFRRKPTNNTTASDPVDVVTGEFVENCVDFTIEATIPLEAARFFSSHYYFSTEIGHGRISNFDAHIIQLDEENYCLFKGSGQLVPFTLPLAHKGPARSRDFPNLVFMRDNLGRLLIIKERKCSFFQKFQDDTMFFLARIEDLNDNSISFKRDLAGVLHRLEHSDGFELHFSNDETGRRLGISWHGEGEVLPLVTYAYDASGNLTQVTCMGGMSYQYSYNDKGQLCSWQDRSKLTHVTLHYDEEDRVVYLQSTGAWDDDRFEYDDEARLTRYIDGKSGAVECYTYDENLNITCHHHANGHETRYEYDAQGRKIAEIDAKGGRASFSYDEMGYLSDYRDAQGRRQSWKYHPSGLISSWRDGVGHQWHYEYDRRLNLISQYDAHGVKTKFEYNFEALLGRTIHQDGTIETYHYDRYKRLCKTTRSDDIEFQCERDVFGRILTQATSDGGWVRFSYERRQLGQPLMAPTWVELGTGQRYHYTYADNGHVCGVRDDEGRQWVYSYGAFNSLEAISEPGGGHFRYSYDNQNRLCVIENAAEQKWLFERDLMGNLICERDFNGLTFTYTHDEKGNVVKRVNPDGSCITYRYDKTDLLLEKQLYAAQNGTCEDVLHYLYDGCGRLVSASNNHSKLTLKYDASGRVIEEAVNGHVITSQYDAHGRLVATGLNDDKIFYAHDKAGKLTHIDFVGAGARLDVTYETVASDFAEGSRGTKMIYCGDKGFRHELVTGPFGTLQLQKAGFSVGAFGRGLEAAREAQKLGLSLKESGEQIKRHYAWQGLSMPQTIDDKRWGRNQFDYNDAAQIISRHRDGALLEQYDYDALENVVASGAGSHLKKWQKVEDTHLVRFAGSGRDGRHICLHYDDHHRVIRREMAGGGQAAQTWHYRWNAESQLVGVTTPQGEEWHYTYDALGRRVAKISRTRQRRYERSSEAEQGIGASYVWRGNLVIATAPLLVDKGADWNQKTLWHYLPESYVPLAQQTAQGALHYIVADHLGTVREMFTEKGYLVWSVDYELWGSIYQLWQNHYDKDTVTSAPNAARGFDAWDYGNLLMRTDPQLARESQRCPLRFAGQWEDAETGLYYNRFRYYDPLSGHYLSPDPIGVRGGMREHSYVKNPLGQTDPLGLGPTDVGNQASTVGQHIPGNTPPTGGHVNAHPSHMPADVQRSNGLLLLPAPKPLLLPTQKPLWLPQKPDIWLPSSHKSILLPPQPRIIIPQQPKILLPTHIAQAA